MYAKSFAWPKNRRLRKSLRQCPPIVSCIGGVTASFTCLPTSQRATGLPSVHEAPQCEMTSLRCHETYNWKAKTFQLDGVFFFLLIKIFFALWSNHWRCEATMDVGGNPDGRLDGRKICPSARRTGSRASSEDFCRAGEFVAFQWRNFAFASGCPPPRSFFGTCVSITARCIANFAAGDASCFFFLCVCVWPLQRGSRRNAIQFNPEAKSLAGN